MFLFAGFDHLSDPNQRRSIRKQRRNRAENHAKGLQNGRKTPKNGYWKARGLFVTTMPHVRAVSLRPNSTNPNPKPVGEGFGFVVYFDYPNFNLKKEKPN